MKNKILTFFILAIATIGAMAQTVNENPKSNLPYYFTDFVDAQVLLKGENAGAITKAKVNINLFNGQLQYIGDDGNIRIVENLHKVDRIKIGTRFEFIIIDGFTQRVLAESSNFLVVNKVIGDKNDLMESTGAYGTSTSTAAVDAINKKLIGGVNNFNFTTLMNDNTGVSFEPESKTYLVGNGEITQLTKRNLLKRFEAKSDDLKKYLKQEKPDFKDQMDLQRLVKVLESL